MELLTLQVLTQLGAGDAATLRQVKTFRTYDNLKGKPFALFAFA